MAIHTAMKHSQNLGSNQTHHKEHSLQQLVERLRSSGATVKLVLRGMYANKSNEYQKNGTLLKCICFPQGS